MIQKDDVVTFYHNMINKFSGSKAINMKNFLIFCTCTLGPPNCHIVRNVDIKMHLRNMNIVVSFPNRDIHAQSYHIEIYLYKIAYSCFFILNKFHLPKYIMLKNRLHRDL